MKLNKNFDRLESNYLFAQINKQTQKYISENPNKPLYRLSIGDVTQPLSPAIILAMNKASLQMGQKTKFKGYGDYEGYLFLRQQIVEYYSKMGVEIDVDQITVTDGAKSVLAMVLDLFESGISVSIPNPVYPVYFDTNILRGNKINFLNGNRQNNFLPNMPNFKTDIIYICNPNNPTGAAYSKKQLKEFVEYANMYESIIIYDSAYQAFVECKMSDERDIHVLDLDMPPRSIYQIQGAEYCAIEICSLSKTAGFSGLRVGYTVVPDKIKIQGVSISKLWQRLISTRTNGVSYIGQCAANAALSEQGIAHNKKQIAYYLQNAKTILQSLQDCDTWCCGGVFAPYVWLECPDAMTGWQFFERMLSIGIVGTPGEGFGSNGAGYFRLSAFAQKNDISKAMGLVKRELKGKG
jgi:LL-diaminopimelate aminotransferase